MAGPRDTSSLLRSGAYALASGVLSALRWVVLAIMLAITFAWPVPGRMGHPVWALILLFSGYNLLVELVPKWVGRLRSPAWVLILDLPMAALVYFLDYDPGGPLFAVFYLILISAATTLTLRGILIYTSGTMLVVAAIAPTLPGWSATDRQLRELTTRLVVLALVGVVTNVLTGRWAAEQERSQTARREADRLRELDQLRSEFVSSVSHNLRTPLTALRGGLGWLEVSLADQLGPEQRALVGNCRRNTERLRMLVDDLIAYNHLEAGTLGLERQPLDLRAVAEEAVSALRPFIEEKGQELEVDLPEPLLAEGDRRHLAHALAGLLCNAWEHTPRGTHIAVTGRVEDREIVLSVTDDGPGIPGEAREAVFRSFHRLDPYGSGSGLGLTVARGIVEFHGGRIRVESEPGRGSSFRVALPRSERGGES